MLMRGFSVVGHRGAAGLEPENTLRSFRKAIDLGADWIELDIHMTKDGELVVIHDDNVDRTTDGEGPVCNLSLEEIRGLNAGLGEKIPTLQEVVDLARGKIKVDIEIKQAGVESRLVDLLLNNDFLKSAIVTSFKMDYLKNVKKLCDAVSVGAIIGERPEDLIGFLEHLKRDIRADSVFASTRAISPDAIEIMRRMGFRVGVWNTDTFRDIRRFAQMRPDFLCSNYPDRVLSAMAALPV